MSAITLDSQIKPVQDFSLVTIPVHFITTLVEPLLFSPAACQRAFQNSVHQIKQDGGLGILRRVGRDLKEHPLDAFVLAGSAALGLTNVAQYSSLVPLAVITASTVRNGKTLCKMIEKVEAKNLIEKGFKITLYGATAVYLASSFPAAAALEWNSVQAAKDYYSGGPCIDDGAIKIRLASRCIHEGKTLEECGKLISEEIPKDLHVFTLHPNNAVSIVQLDKAKVCFLTALSREAAVTKTCFLDLKNPSSRTVEELKDVTLMQAHKGLHVGESVRHVAIHPVAAKSCGTFDERPVVEDLGDKPTCLVTALRPGGDVSLTCFNPDQPTAIILKKVEGIDLNFQEDERPVSIVIKDPKLLGIDLTSADKKGKCECKEA